MNKISWLKWAEIVDAYRVFPRLFLAGYSAFAVTFIFEFARWYHHLPANERGYEESGAMFGIITALVKFWGDIYDTYSQNGRDWTKQDMPK